MCPEAWYKTFLLVISNVGGLLAAYRLCTYRFYTLAVVLTFSAVVSAIYHASDMMCVPIMGMYVGEWQVIDFWLAFGSIAAVAVLIAKWMPPYRHMQNVMLLVLLIIIIWLVLWNKTSFSTILVTTTVIFTFIALKYAIVDGGIPHNLSLFNLLFTLMFGAIGISFFIADTYAAPQAYWWMHSLWHFCVYAAPFFAVDIFNPYRRVCFWRKHKTDNQWVFRFVIHHPEDWYDTDYYGTTDYSTLIRVSDPQF